MPHSVRNTLICSILVLIAIGGKLLEIIAISSVLGRAQNGLFILKLIHCSNDESIGEI